MVLLWQRRDGGWGSSQIPYRLIVAVPDLRVKGVRSGCFIWSRV